VDLNNFDTVQIMRTTGISWVSGPKGTMPSPHGHWIIAGFVGNSALICKDGTTVKVPTSDIRRVGVYSVENVLEKLEQVGKAPDKIDMIDVVSEEFKMDPQVARRFIKRYNLPERAISEEHKKRLLQRLHKHKETEDYG